MEHTFASFVTLVMVWLVALQVYASYEDGLLTMSQARRSGRLQALPFIWHSGMWGDMLVLPFWFYCLIRNFAEQWSVASIYISMILGMGVSLALHLLVYCKAKTPEAHAHDGKLTPAGWLHLVYMGVGIALAIQFYLFTTNIAPWFVVLTSVMWAVHMTLATHIIPALWCTVNKEDWYPHKPWRDRGAQIFVVGLTVVLAIATVCKL